MSDPDRRWMIEAIDVSKNSMDEDSRSHPKVGAVAVNSNGEFIENAFRGEGGTPRHAEYILLEKLEQKLNDKEFLGVTIYTTLEPCTARGENKIPCARRLVNSKVARVVIGILDPNLDVSGHGVRLLGLARIKIDFFDPDLEEEIITLNKDFVNSIARSGGRPHPYFIQENFYESQWLLDLNNPELVKKFVFDHWGNILGTSEFQSLDPWERRDERDIEPIIKNSRKWTIKIGSKYFFLREIRRKAVALPQRISSKHLFLRWLARQDTKGFSTKSPLPVNNSKKNQYHIQSRGLIYELYNLVPDCDTCESFSKLPDYVNKLSELLVELDVISENVLKEESIVSELKSRFTEIHQFTYLKYEIKTVEVLRDYLSSSRGNYFLGIVADEVCKALTTNPESNKYLENIRSEANFHLVHGDLTEDNIRVDKFGNFWLFDWDTVRLVQTGPFDLAFALVRLSSPKRYDPSFEITDYEVEMAKQILEKYKEKFIERVTTIDDKKFMKLLTLAFEDVRREFSFRMLEYFNLLQLMPSKQEDVSYIKRCNPGRVRDLRIELCGKSKELDGT